MNATVGRNEPCPCGSGRKFKRCHGGVASAGLPDRAARERIAQRLIRALHDEGDRTQRDAFDHFIEPIERFGRDRIAPFMSGETTESAITTFALFDLRDEDERTFAARYAARRALVLSHAETAYIEALQQSFVDFYEVRRVDVGKGLELRNLRHGTDTFVHERAASESLVVYDIVASRVIETEPGRFEIFPPMLVFGQIAGRDALDAVREAVPDVFDEADKERLTRYALKIALPTIHAIWVRSHLPPTPRELHTSEGEPLEPTTVRFLLADRARAVAALEASDAFERDARDDGSYAFLGREGSGQVFTGRLVLGRLDVGEDDLVAEVMSRSRVGRLKDALAAADDGAFAFVSEMHHDVDVFMGSRSESADVENDEDDQDNEGYEDHEEYEDGEADAPSRADVAATLAEFDERWHRAWLDEHIPALGGKTPREAALAPELRLRVVALIKNMLIGEERARRKAFATYDSSWMWKELGLEP
jgi:hypothetical protein